MVGVIHVAPTYVLCLMKKSGAIQIDMSAHHGTRLSHLVGDNMPTGTETRYVNKHIHQCENGEILRVKDLIVRTERDDRIEYSPVLKYHEKAHITAIYDAITPVANGSGVVSDTWVRVEIVESEIKEVIGRELEDYIDNITRWGGYRSFDMFVKGVM